jgi:hypothetical protein
MSRKTDPAKKAAELEAAGLHWNTPPSCLSATGGSPKMSIYEGVQTNPRFDKHVELMDAVNFARDERTHREAELRLEGFRTALRVIYPHYQWTECDLWYLDLGCSRPMTCGRFIDWKPWNFDACQFCGNWVESSLDLHQFNDEGKWLCADCFDRR